MLPYLLEFADTELVPSLLLLQCSLCQTPVCYMERSVTVPERALTVS